MTQQPNKPNPPRTASKALATTDFEKTKQQANTTREISADLQMIQTMRNLKDKQLRNYEIRDMVTQAKELGEYLKEINLKTNQIRKFLEALNRLKVELVQDKDESFAIIKDEVVLLKPKLAYATARQEDDRRNNPVKPLSEVLSEAIDKVQDTPDFYRLVQLIESILAYHKAAGGKN